MFCLFVCDRHTLSVSSYRYPESRDEQKPGPERRVCEAFVIPPKSLMQWPLGHSRGRNLGAMISFTKVEVDRQQFIDFRQSILQYTSILPTSS